MGSQAKPIFLTKRKCLFGIIVPRINIFEGPEEEKIMLTGVHKVCDIRCKTCMKIVGWKYVYDNFLSIYRSLHMNKVKNTKREDL